MTVFKVHYTDTNGNKCSTFASADTPDAAADGVKQNVPGAIVTKVKVDRTGRPPLKTAVKKHLAEMDEIMKGGN